VHNKLQLHLKGVKVQPGIDQYSIIIGCDVLAPSAHFRGCQISPGAGVEWRSRDGISCWMPVYKGPRGQEPKVAATTDDTVLAGARAPGGTTSRPGAPRGPSAADRGDRGYMTSTQPTAAKKLLEALASARDEELSMAADQLPPLADHRVAVDAAVRRLVTEGVPQGLAEALGQCLFRRYARGHHSVHQRFTAVVAGWERHGADGV
jgi:hypothetical protein